MNSQLQASKLSAWLKSVLNVDSVELKPLTGDAGFRQYFRVVTQDKRALIAINSPGDKCNNQGYVMINQSLEAQQIKVPSIYHVDWQQGFFCIEDLGDQLLSDRLSENNLATLYQHALAIIPRMLGITTIQGYQPAIYDDDFVKQELTIFSQWLVTQYLDIELSKQEQQALDSCFDTLIKNVSEQPQAFMHRDFHSRNLMLQEDGQLAVIDYQDAVVGPITYDAVSLLKDCYCKWPACSINRLFEHFIALIEAQFPQWQYPKATWQRWFDLMGMQRHFKAAGIFARLHLRDGKSGYLADIPLTLSYIVDVCQQYPEFAQVGLIMEQKILPALRSKA